MNKVDEHVLSMILEYNTARVNYSKLFRKKSLRSIHRNNHKKYIRDMFSDMIVRVFSSLYYMTFLRQPRTRDEINQVFMSLDYHGLFHDPNYYDLEDYLQVFKIFVERAFDYNVEREPLHEEKNTYVSKYSSNSQIKKSRTLYALNLM